MDQKISFDEALKYGFRLLFALVACCQVEAVVTRQQVATQVGRGVCCRGASRSTNA
jgi:hypothetical protein